MNIYENLYELKFDKKNTYLLQQKALKYILLIHHA